ncbi:MDR family oxidoreductase [Martelella mediterranea]|uniref:Acrylyl-CoA reductase (NADPH) n=1 Tax=Martelella mediterranea TaxID=293089 RepID=A0A4R3NTH3_9HYPH|nr:MDR family oxidoreductase [Martelella mediterranea]TCT40346.1 acrylyl-CoA reductase (NADPH) [Martelella mediterranea]
MSDNFPAMIIRDKEQKGASLETLSPSDLPDYPVLVRVDYSSLNYKDGLAVTGKGRIARRFPMVPGIDVAGTVVESDDPAFSPGDQVIANGHGLSETEWGAYSTFQRLKPEWLMHQPEGFSQKQAMAIGTAGYTAALCVNQLISWGGLASDQGQVLVTGAAGGVGSFAVSLLSSLGFDVTASTGRSQTHDYLRSLGASSFIDRAELSEPGKPLQAERWIGAVDTVGSVTLANVLAQTAYGGAVTACGLAGGYDLPASVMPHILRSVALIGVDSVMAPKKRREAAWRLLQKTLQPEHIDIIAPIEIGFDRLPKAAEAILAGKIRGRVVLKLG